MPTEASNRPRYTSRSNGAYAGQVLRPARDYVRSIVVELPTGRGLRIAFVTAAARSKHYRSCLVLWLLRFISFQAPFQSTVWRYAGIVAYAPLAAVHRPSLLMSAALALDPDLPWLAAIAIPQCEQDLASLTPQRGLIPVEPIKRVTRQVCEANKGTREPFELTIRTR